MVREYRTYSKLSRINAKKFKQSTIATQRLWTDLAIKSSAKINIIFTVEWRER